MKMDRTIPKLLCGINAEIVVLQRLVLGLQRRPMKRRHVDQGVINVIHELGQQEPVNYIFKELRK